MRPQRLKMWASATAQKYTRGSRWSQNNKCPSSRASANKQTFEQTKICIRWNAIVICDLMNSNAKGAFRSIFLSHALHFPNQARLRLEIKAHIHLYLPNLCCQCAALLATAWRVDFERPFIESASHWSSWQSLLNCFWGHRVQVVLDVIKGDGIE